MIVQIPGFIRICYEILRLIFLQFKEIHSTQHLILDAKNSKTKQKPAGDHNCSMLISKTHGRRAYWTRAMPFYRAALNCLYLTPSLNQKSMCFGDAISVCDRSAGMPSSFVEMTSDWFQWFSHCYWCWHVLMLVSNRIRWHDLWSRCTSVTCKSTQFPPNWWPIRQGKVRRYPQMWLSDAENAWIFFWGEIFEIYFAFTANFTNFSYQISHPRSCTCHADIWCM